MQEKAMSGSSMKSHFFRFVSPKLSLLLLFFLILRFLRGGSNKKAPFLSMVFFRQTGVLSAHS
ncbi:MAG: hypothetical protein HUK10_15725 [Bacteroides heparinolyticus]|nr:hypothetical protein [Bacteroides heparinolyticus]